LEFCSRDATTVRITYNYGGDSKELVAASAYLPYDSDEPPPTKEVSDIIILPQQEKATHHGM
jgi:hypothetical protein